MRDKLFVAGIGLLFGYCLHRIGFSSWTEVHNMFAFTDQRLLFGFMLAVVILAIGWQVIGRLSHPHWSSRKLHPGTIPGGILFGAGWAITGACPSISLVQLGEGRLYALFTLAGVIVGNFLYPYAHAHWFRWTTRSCIDD